jgi:TatA/E family protein of Tat protein translocase
MPFGIQPWHLIVIAIIALVVFGPSRLPDIGRSLGKTLTEFRKGTKEMTEGFKEEITAYTPPEQPQAPAVFPAPDMQAPTANMYPAQPVSTDQAAVTYAGGNFCTSCGASNPVGARFCNKCGAQILQAEAAQTEIAQPESTEPDAGQPQA